MSLDAGCKFVVGSLVEIVCSMTTLVLCLSVDVVCRFGVGSLVEIVCSMATLVLCLSVDVVCRFGVGSLVETVCSMATLVLCLCRFMLGKDLVLVLQWKMCAVYLLWCYVDAG